MLPSSDDRGDPARSDVDTTEGLPRGTVIGRYLLLGEIESAGPDMVYAAYDPELDRRVLLRLLTPRTGGDRLHEARTLAQISHPNVNAVHAVIRRGDEVWLAAEFVAGSTLTDWTNLRPRRWNEVLRLLMDVARGIAAAHAAGLHPAGLRPESVTIGHDGAARVMDLEAGAAPRDEATQASRRSADQAAWGAMALDLLRHDRYGAHRTSVSKAPRWLRGVIDRATASDPARRWPTMGALVAAIEKGRTWSRVRTAVVSLMVVASLGAVAAEYRRRDTASRVAACEAAGAEIERTWNDGTRPRIRAAFEATGVRDATATVDRMMPWLDERAAEWRRGRTEACLNAQVRGLWSGELAARAAWCFEDRQLDFDTFVAEFERATPAVVNKAVTAAASLRTAAVCLDEVTLRHQPTPPVLGREFVREVRAEVARSHSLTLAGELQEALAVVRRVRERAEGSSDWASLLAAVRSREANLLERTGAYPAAEKAAREAYFAALPAGAWDIASRAATDLILNVGRGQGRPAEARVWAHHAEIALAHAGDLAGLREAHRLNNLASVEFAAGAFPDAQALYERALAIRERSHAPGHPDIAESLSNVASVRHAVGAFAEARPLYERALAIQKQTLGPHHPSVAHTLNNLAVVYDDAGDYTQARALHEEALAIREGALGQDHPDVAQSLNNLALTYVVRREYAQARPLFERSLAIQKKATPGHPSLAVTMQNLAAIDYYMGHRARAQAQLERALALLEAAVGPEHPSVGGLLNTLAELHTAARSYERARETYARSLAILERTIGPNHPEFALVLYNLAAVHLAEERPGEALPLLERAVTVYAGVEGLQDGEAETHFDLARALVGVGRDRKRAVALARRARETLLEAGTDQRERLGEVERWLARHDTKGAQ